MAFTQENPVLEKLCLDLHSIQLPKDSTDLFTIRGVIDKTLISLGLVVTSCLVMWFLYYILLPINPYLFLPLIGVNIFAFIASFVIFITFQIENEYASSLAPLFAITEGISISGLSLTAEKMYPGVITEAILLTFICFFIILILYRYGLVKYNQKVQSAIIGCFIGYILFNIYMFFSFFWAHQFFMTCFTTFYTHPFLYIGASLLIMIFIITSLIGDFYYIENAVNMKMYKDAEWYAVFGLTFKIVWLYLRSLGLISYVRLITSFNTENSD